MKFWKLHSALVLFLCIVTIYGFRGSSQYATVLTGIELNSDLITEANLQEHIGNFIGDSIDDTINIRLLEEKLKGHPAVQEAEVYSTLDGALFLSIRSYRPLARWISKQGNVYLTEEGHFSADLVDGSARVPILFGEATEIELEEAVWVFGQIYNNAYWKHQLTALEIETDEYVFQVRKGDHLIRMTRNDEVMMQLEKLKIVYDSVLENGRWGYYKEFDLRFKDQVICLKQ